MNTIKHITKPLATFVATLIITLASSTNTASAASDFEGELNMRISTNTLKKKDNQPAAMTLAIWMKQGKLRMELKPDETTKADAKAEKSDLANMNFIMIADGKTGDTYMLMPDSKMYMVSNSKGNANASTRHDEDDYIKTGRTDTILGWHVDEYVTNTEKKSGSYTEMWLATGLGDFMTMNNKQGNQQETTGWEKFLADNHLFPLKLTEYPKKGADQYTNRYEVTKIDKGSLPDSLFEIPADYQKFDLGAMFGGMRQQMGEAAKEASKDAAKDAAKKKAKSSIWDKIKSLER